LLCEHSGGGAGSPSHCRRGLRSRPPSP
jgi:hypothetical protein